MMKKLLLAGVVMALIGAPTLLFSTAEVAPAGCTWDDGICSCSGGACLQTPECHSHENALCVTGNFKLCGCTEFQEVPAH